MKLGIKEKIRLETENGTLDGEKMKTYGKHLKKFEAKVSLAEVRYAQYRRAQTLKKREKQRGNEKMIALIILSVILIILTTLMFILYFTNDIALRKEIEVLNSRIEYYIRVLKDRSGK